MDKFEMNDYYMLEEVNSFVYGTYTNQDGEEVTLSQEEIDGWVPLMVEYLAHIENTLETLRESLSRKMPNATADDANALNKDFSSFISALRLQEKLSNKLNGFPDAIKLKDKLATGR